MARAALSATSEEKPPAKSEAGELRASKGGDKKKPSSGAADEENSSQASTTTKAAKLKMCRFFASAGTCKAGAACKFAHVSTLPNDTAAADSNGGRGISDASAEVTTDAVLAQLGKASKKARPCRRGAACKTAGCLFDHPPTNKGGASPPVVKKVLQRGAKDDNVGPAAAAAAASEGESVANANANGSTAEVKSTGTASSSLFCEPCNLQCTSIIVYEDHCKGRKHAATMKRLAASSSSDSVGAAASGGSEGGEGAKADSKGKRKKKDKVKVTGWWRSVEDIDPISLEPISELDYPPFELAREVTATEPAAEGRGVFKN